MTDLQKLREWIATFPEFDILSRFQVDSTDRVPNQGGIFPGGLVEISRQTTICGGVVVTNQLNFAVYYVFSKAVEDDTDAAFNADWVLSFQRWVQEQSVLGLAPKFGNTDQRNEQIKAENGTLYDAEESGTAMYAVQISVRFKISYQEENEWLI